MNATNVFFNSHEELLALNGVYAEMWNNQIKGEGEDTTIPS